MNIQEILQKTEIERKIGSRFPARVIFCNSLSGYEELVNQLRGSCDQCWNIADFCSPKYPDRYPKFKRLFKKIEENQDKHILLLSVGEYLRMASKIEIFPGGDMSQFYALWSRMEYADSKTRIFIPLYAAKELFDRAVGHVDPRMEGFLWDFDCPDDGNRSITVLSDKFRGVLTDGKVAQNIKEWLQNWEILFKSGPSVIVTEQVENWEKTCGKISVDVVKDPYDFLKSIDHSIESVPQVSSPNEYWVDLVVRLADCNSINAALLNGLNLKEFDSIAIISQWGQLDSVEKWYLWLWYQLNSPDEYVATVIKDLSVNELDTLPEHLRNDIVFYMDEHENWIDQRRSLLCVLQPRAPKKEFFVALDDRDPETALKVLSGGTIEEKAYIIKTICRWLRNNESKSLPDPAILFKVSRTVSDIYPELSAYLNTETSLYKEYTDYFEWYKRKKIINRYVDRPLSAKSTDFLDSRYSILSQYNGKDCMAYWIDGLGLEWVALIKSVIDRYAGDIECVTPYITRSVIPSATEFNEQWDKNTYTHIKKNRLDQISHKGMPDDKNYFLAIANQINVITEMVVEAVLLLQDHEYVIITGDHGSSRLAALSFHSQGILVPKGGYSKDLGRYCLLDHMPARTEVIPDSASVVKFNDSYFLVIKNYDHFIQSGNAAGGNNDENAVAGEVHGGLTVEECVVPVIVLKRKSSIAPLSYEISEQSLLMKGGRASTHIKFNKIIRELKVNVDNGICESTQEDDYSWSLRFENLKPGNVTLRIIADSKILPQGTILSVKIRGIQTNQDMRGLP